MVYDDRVRFGQRSDLKIPRGVYFRNYRRTGWSVSSDSISGGHSMVSPKSGWDCVCVCVWMSQGFYKFNKKKEKKSDNVYIHAFYLYIILPFRLPMADVSTEFLGFYAGKTTAVKNSNGSYSIKHLLSSSTLVMSFSQY